MRLRSKLKNQRKGHNQRSNIQQTLSPNLTHHQKHKKSSLQSDTRHYVGQKQQPCKNQPPPSQHNLIFPHTSNRPRKQRYNSRQQHDSRLQEFQTYGSNSLQDSFQNKTSNRSTKKRDWRWHNPTSGKKTVFRSGPKILFVL